MSLDMMLEAKPASPRMLALRLGAGLAQGLAALVLIHQFWIKPFPEAWNWAISGAMAAVLVAPLIFMGGLGTLRRTTLTVWTIAAALIAAGLGGYGYWAHLASMRGGDFPVLALSGVVLFFIAHHLIAAADEDRRLVARYPTYFDGAWKHGVQLALSLAFTAVFWALLFLGAGLFKLIGIDALLKLYDHDWFHIPATTLAFAAAVHLTDVRVGLIRGVRTVALVLLSWLLPLLTLIAAAFLLTLPFTGLKPLWDTKASTAVVLTAAALLIVLINAAYQDGRPESPPAAVLRWAARIAGVLIAPLVGIAGYGLVLRIGQYGLTPERVYAAACVMLAAVYAVGYLAAAVRPRPWMKTLEPTNVAAAALAVLVILALTTPVADPSRVSVDDQMARIVSGRTKPGEIDYAFFGPQSGRYGVSALKTLQARGGDVGARAADALAGKYVPAVADKPVIFHVYPQGAAIPDGFLVNNRLPGDYINCQEQEHACDLYVLDADGDGRPEVAVDESSYGSLNVYQAQASGPWKQVATLEVCAAGGKEALKAGAFKTVPSKWRELEIGGRRFGLTPRPDCDTPAPPVAAGATKVEAAAPIER
ncbi:MAG: hypothetical protein JWP35_1047 [Caulobacter sp.]|nr:hypothetical protein [Caulobacter sp.]